MVLKKKCFIAILSLLVVFCLCFSQTLISSKDVVYAEDVYSSSLHSLRENDTGTAVLQDDIIVVNFNDKSISLPAYDVYKVYEANNYRYMAADTLKEGQQDILILSLTMYSMDNVKK